jgi:hypothetical protein
MTTSDLRNILTPSAGKSEGYGNGALRFSEAMQCLGTRLCA